MDVQDGGAWQFVVISQENQKEHLKWL